MATLNDLLTAAQGLPVTDLHCTIKNAFQPRQVQTQYGAKTVLDMVLADAGAEMRASWWEPTLDGSVIQGAKVIIAATLNQKNQLSGAVVRIGKDKNGQPRHEVSISGDHLQLEPPPAAATPAAQSAPSSSTVYHAANGKMTESDLYALIARAANRINDVLTAANGQPPSSDALAASVNTIVIAATNGRVELAPTDADELPPF